MKIHFKSFIILVISILYTSCSTDLEDLNISSSSKEETPDIVLQERGANLPEITTRVLNVTKKSKNVGSGLIGNTDQFLGYGYQVGNSILGDFSNIGDIVLDLKKIKSISSEYAKGRQLFGNETRSYAYTNFESYEYNSSITKKKTSGFSINIAKVFSFGRKKTTTEVFTKYINSSQNTVYGELNIDIRNSLFTLQNSDGARKIYARQCLSETFLRNLYSSTIGNIQESYGNFVVTGYYTGGKAFALYAGLSNSSGSLDKKEKDMNKTISASFTYDTSDAKGKLKIGSDNGSSQHDSTSVRETEIYIRTLGGKRQDHAMATAIPLNKLKLDLTSWVQSLENVNTHTMIDISDQGLCPISGFILEENFRRRFDGTIDGVLDSANKLITPYIEIILVYVRLSSDGEPLYEIAAVLNTRQGDKIVLSDGLALTASDSDLKANVNIGKFNEIAKKIANEKKKYFDLRIVANASRKINPNIRNPYICIRLNNFSEDKLYRFKNADSGIEYLYDKSNKFAISHFSHPVDEDWILDEYGIRDWVENLPAKKISMATIANSYKIIGL